MMRSFVVLPLLLLATTAGAQGVAVPPSAERPAPSARSFDFSISNIMRGPEIVGRPPEDVRWSPDGRWIYFRWVEPGTDWREPLRLHRVRATAGARPERVPEAQLDSVGPLVAEGVHSGDGRLRAVIWEDDLFVVELPRGVVRRLTETLAEERDPSFAADGRRVFFVRDDNVFSVDLAGGLVRQLTNIRQGPLPKDSTATGQRGSLEAAQLELFEAIRDRARADSVRKAEREREERERPAPFHLARRERLADVAVSPAGDALVFTTRVTAEDARTPQVPAYVTRSGYTEQLDARIKVGDAQAAGRVVHMRLPSGTATVLDVAAGDSSKTLSFAGISGWNRAGTRVLLTATSRDFKTRRLLTASADSGVVRTVDVLRDSAWVGGPCGGCSGWVDDRVWFVSEADGWAHLYTAAPDGGGRRQLTSGRWEVLGAELSPDRRTFRLTTNRGTPFEQHFETIPVGGGEPRRLTARTGGHDVTMSPDGAWLADVFSTANRPPELFLARATPGAPMEQLTTSPTAEWLAHHWIVPEIVRIPASDGVEVPARIYRPADVGAQPNGAAVIFVHGAGYLHNVHNYWSTYYREYMFNQWLAARGYVVLDVDYRGSAGYGRDWRTAIYRHMGGRDLQDHVDASRWLGTRFGIDPERVGIYGGSYGGFITLMALFTEAEHFGAGAALRSVTDWAHYNHPYTARILNLPQDDTLAFRRSSPIWFAEGLEDPLLIAHGMVDVNVHFQDVVRLSQRLIELGKTDWEMAVYPVEDHAFVRPSSWTDEYRRIAELFDEHLGPARTEAARPTSPGGGRR
jgi:dipeptidyl aminopeptidase/acylaminoacyl peptidase